MKSYWIFCLVVAAGLLFASDLYAKCANWDDANELQTIAGRCVVDHFDDPDRHSCDQVTSVADQCSAYMHAHENDQVPSPSQRVQAPPTPATTGRSMAEFDLMMKRADACVKQNGFQKCQAQTSELDQKFPGWRTGKPSNIVATAPGSSSQGLQRLAPPKSQLNACGLGQQPDPHAKGQYQTWDARYCTCNGGSFARDTANDGYQCHKNGVLAFGCSWIRDGGGYYQCLQQ